MPSSLGFDDNSLHVASSPAADSPTPLPAVSSLHPLALAGGSGPLGMAASSGLATEALVLQSSTPFANPTALPAAGVAETAAPVSSAFAPMQPKLVSFFTPGVAAPSSKRTRRHRALQVSNCNCVHNVRTCCVAVTSSSSAYPLFLCTFVDQLADRSAVVAMPSSIAIPQMWPAPSSAAISTSPAAAASIDLSAPHTVTSARMEFACSSVPTSAPDSGQAFPTVAAMDLQPAATTSSTRSALPLECLDDSGLAVSAPPPAVDSFPSSSISPLKPGFREFRQLPSFLFEDSNIDIRVRLEENMRQQETRRVRSLLPVHPAVTIHEPYSSRERQIVLDAAELAYQSSSDPKERMATHFELLAQQLELSAPTLVEIEDPVDSPHTTLGMLAIHDSSDETVLVPHTARSAPAHSPDPASPVAASSAASSSPAVVRTSAALSPSIAAASSHQNAGGDLPATKSFPPCWTVADSILCLIYGQDSQRNLNISQGSPFRATVEEHMEAMERGPVTSLGRCFDPVVYPAEWRAWILQTAEDAEECSADPRKQIVHFINCLAEKHDLPGRFQ